jgi:high-affinity nickel-transport protein
VVLGIAAAVGTLSERWAPPAWLDTLGAWISILFLLALGALNLHAVLAAPRQGGGPGRPQGRLLGPLARAQAAGVAGVGALFALSFDTVASR